MISFLDKNLTIKPTFRTPNEVPSQREASERHRYTLSTFQTLVRDFKNQKIIFFSSIKKGPKKHKISDVTRDKIITLRKRNHFIYEIRIFLSGMVFIRVWIQLIVFLGGMVFQNCLVRPNLNLG